MDSDGLLKNIAIGSALVLCVLTAIVAIRLAEQANSRANKLSVRVDTQQRKIDLQEDALQQMLAMAGAHQGLIEGILDNQAGIVGLMEKRSKNVRLIASRKP